MSRYHCKRGAYRRILFADETPQELLLLREALLTTVLQVVVHVLRDQVVGHAAVDEEWRKLLELGPQLLRYFDVHFREPKPLTGTQLAREDPRCSLRVGVSRDDSLAAWHLLHHCAGVERIGVVPQDALGWLRVLVVGANLGLASHVLAREYQGGAADYSRLQHVVRLFVRGV